MLNKVFYLVVSKRVCMLLETYDYTCLLWFFICYLFLQLYRLERYDECLAVYRDLVRNSQDDYDEERKTNLSAVVAAQSNWEKVVPVSISVYPHSHKIIFLCGTWLVFCSMTGEPGPPRRHTRTVLQRCMCTHRTRPAESGNENLTKGWRSDLTKIICNCNVCVTLQSISKNHTWLLWSF